MDQTTQQQPSPDKETNPSMTNSGGVPPSGGNGSGGRIAGFIMIAVGVLIGVNWLFPSFFFDAFDSLGSSLIGFILIGFGIFFIAREWTPNKKKPYRLGRITTGVTFIWQGTVLAAASIIPADWSAISFRLWPLILIGFGLEYLFRRRSDGLKTKFDVSGLFLILLVYIITAGAQIDRSINFLVIGEGYSVQDTPVVVAAANPISLQLEASVGNITIIPATDGKVTLTPTYRSWKEQSLDKLKQKTQFDIQEDNGEITVQLEPKKSTNINLFSLYDHAIDLQIALPAEMQLSVSTDLGKINVTDHNNVHKLQTDVGIIELKNVQGDDTRLQVDVGVIKVEQFRGQLVAETDIGMIEVEGEPTDDWSLTTAIGYLETRLPSNGSYLFDLNVEIGNTDYPVSDVVDAGKNPYQIHMSADIGSAVAKMKSNP